MKADELRALTVEELERKIKDFREELFNLRLQLAMNELDNTARIREVRRNIARALTILTEKKRQQKAE